MVRESEVKLVDGFPLSYFAEIALVMQQCQLNRDVIHGDDRIQKGLSDFFEALEGISVHLFTTPSLGGIDHDHVADGLPQLRGVVRTYWSVVAFCDIVKEVHQGHLLLLVSEGRFQLGKFVADATQRPHIGILGIAFVLDEFR